MTIRRYRPEDRAAVEAICAETGLSGRLEEFFCDKPLFVKLWLDAYLYGEPESCWVAEDEEGVQGYLVGSMKPGFKWRALRLLLPHLMKGIGRLITGKYRHHPPSERFIKWLAFRSWRETPEHPQPGGNFHFNVRADRQGSEAAGTEMLAAFIGDLKDRGIPLLYAHVFLNSRARRSLFYRRLGLALYDLRKTTLYPEEAAIACYVTEPPSVENVFETRRWAKKRAKISVVIPAHNEAHTLPTLLDCLDRQWHKPDEIIVVCDGCTDETESIAQSRGCKTVVGTFGHPGPSRNAGIKVAKGDVILLVDADAVLEKEVVGQAVGAYQRGYRLGGPKLRAGVGPWHARLWVWLQNLMGWLGPFHYGTCFFAARELFTRAGLYNESLGWGEDVEISLRMAKRGKRIRLPSTATCNARHFEEHGFPEFLRRVQKMLKSIAPVRRSLRGAESIPRLESVGSPDA